MHLLIFLEERDKIRTAEQVDAAISAQIPDQDLHPQLYEAVSKFMLHGPCSPDRCLENGRCKKYYPKSFCEQTVMNDDGYPKYAHPDNGRTILKKSGAAGAMNVTPTPTGMWFLIVESSWWSSNATSMSRSAPPSSL
jgi:hypothetical protein